MKQFTFSAQVANNLLTVLQGYTKGIRLVVVLTMLLIVGVGQAWGAEKTETISWNTYTTSGTGATLTITWTANTSCTITQAKGDNTSNNVSTSYATSPRWYQYHHITFTPKTGYTIKKVVLTGSSSSYHGQNMTFVEGSGTISKSGNATTITGAWTSSFKIKMGKQFRPGSVVVTYEEAAATVPVTGVSLNKSTLTLTEGGSETLTATILPNDATDKTVTWTTNNSSVATVSSGKVTAIAKGSAIITVTTNDGKKTATCNVTVNPKPKYTVTWDVNGDQSVTTQVTEGSKPTFPATPSSCDATSTTFYGWATATWDGKIDDINGKTIYTSANEMPEVNGAVTYYAVFATKGAGGGAAFDGTSGGDFKIYALVEEEKKYLKGTGSKISPVGESEATEYTFTKISDGVFSIKTGTTYLTYASSTNLGTSNSAYSWTISKGTKGSWRIASTNTTARGIVYRAGTTNQFGGYSTGNITADGTEYYDVEIGDGASVSYSGYITTCAAGDPCDALQAPNVTATATANSITLSWEAVDGATSYNVCNYTTDEAEEVNVLTYTFNGLDPETEYEWEVEAVSATCDGKGTTGTTTTSATPCEKLDDATGLTVETDFVHTDGKTYVKFSWTPADNTKANATSQKICFGKVDEAGTCVDDLEKNLTWTGDLKSKLEPGEYWWSIQALGDGVNYCDGDVVNGTNFTIEAPKASITLSELGVTKTISTYSVGDQYTLPTTSSQSCDGKELVGWSTVEVDETDTKPTSNYYELGAEVTLAATQTFYAVFATKGGVPSTDYNHITSIEDLTDGNYVIAYGYNTTSPTIILKAETKDETTLVATSAGPTDNKYTAPAASNIWEIKKTNTTYTLYNAATSKYIQATNTPSLKLADADPTEFQISYSTDHWKIKLNTDNTYQLVGYTNASGNYFQTKGSPSNSYKIQLYKSASTVVYSAYSTSCIPTYSITYDFAGGTGSHCSNTSVPQGDTYTICDEEPTKEGHTFQGWSDGTNTYAAGATITPTKNTTLTAQWQINTYTVIWSNNGATTEESYEHGETLNVPDPNDIPSCDGVKEFVGWTEQSGYYHANTAPTDLFKTTTATVTADKTYYAVFATKGEGSTNFVLGESGTFKMYANVEGTNYYAQGGVSSNKITSTTEAANASDYTLTYADGVYTIKQGTSNVGNKTNDADLNTNETTWTISEGTNGSWRVTSNVSTSRALSYSTSASAFKAYATSNIESGSYYDIEFGGTSSGYSDYTTTCQQIESIEVQEPQTEFYITDDFTIGSGKVIATLSGGGTTDVTALATFSGYNMNVVGTYTVTVTYMGATATYEITVKPLDNAWVLTWNVSGKTNTGLGPRSVTKGNAIGTLPTPAVPAACAGKTFMGWTESNIVPSDGKGIVYITEATVPSKNTTYYAVFATVNNFCTQKPINQIASGSKVVIVAVASLDAGGTTGKAISSRTSDDGKNLAGDEVSIYDKTINTPHSTCIWTLYKDGEQYYFKQGDYFLNAVDEEGYTNLKWNETKELWNITSVPTYLNTYYMESTHVPDTYIEWYIKRLCFKTYYDIANENGEFDMQFFVTANAGGADITDYTTGCAEYTITYYGFHGGYSTSCSSDGTIVLPVNSLHTVPNCGNVVNDHTNLGREFLNVWMTQPHGGHTFKPGDTFILTQDTTLYAQWKMETTSDVTTLPTDIEDLAGTDIYVYGGTTLNIQPGTTTINSLTLKGGLQEDGSYKMPTVWVPEGATLVRNSNKIYLDLKVNAKNYYPFAVPFAAKNNKNVEYLDSVLAAASTYGTHFAIKTYDGARRAKVGEDKANNWVRVLRDSTLQPGVGYIITALTRPDKDTATIRIPMTVPNTWFKNGEQAVVGTTVRNTIAVTAHAGAAATEHQRHAGWNFVANPYLTSFAGGNVANDGGLDYINGELIIEGSYEYTDEEVPYVTIPAYDFAYYSQHKLSDVKLSPEWSFFVQVGTGGTMNFTTAGRQQAPASIAARNAEERPVKMDVDLILSDNHSSDQTGIIISDRYTDAYEIGRDLEKLFGSAYNLSVYTLMEDNTPLAFQALAIRSSMQVIPVGYRAPEQGEYTFRLNEATSSIDLLNEQYEQLVLVDYQTGELTNLLYTDYTFYSERTQSNSRFAIYAVPRQNAPTDLPNAIGSDEEVRKVIYNDHLYILRDGNVYNGMGQKM